MIGFEIQYLLHRFEGPLHVVHREKSVRLLLVQRHQDVHILLGADPLLYLLHERIDIALLAQDDRKDLMCRVVVGGSFDRFTGDHLGSLGIIEMREHYGCGPGKMGRLLLRGRVVTRQLPVSVHRIREQLRVERQTRQ